MSRYQLAEINIGTIKGPIDSPVMAEFVANLDRINALAETSPGYVWRLKSDEGNATSIPSPWGPEVIVNMSVWTSIEALVAYVYRGDPGAVYRARSRWFEPPEGIPFAMWWVPAGHRPSVSEGLERLDELRHSGPTPRAFTLKYRFEPLQEDAGKATGETQGNTAERRHGKVGS